MIICKDNQLGVDIVLPACLSKDTITTGFIQVKNAEKYKLKVDRGLLDAMHPLSLGLFSEDEIPRLVIRMVFALASWQNGMNFPNPRRYEPHHPNEFTAFDVWCAGLSSDTFNHIRRADLHPTISGFAAPFTSSIGYN